MDRCINPKCREELSEAGGLFCVSCLAAARWGCGAGASVAAVLGGMAGLLYGLWLAMP